jgi:ornithine cyclodeaminase/alanine dehydrogenase-like protein (mu-crystallin family)
MSEILFLDESRVRDLLSMADLIPAMTLALASLSDGTAVQPVRTVVPVEDHRGYLGLMPAYNKALGAKIVTFYPHNEGVHTHNGLILLFKPETGEPLSVLDGRLITEMRTAATSATATKLLARDDSHILAILGSGVQARSHLEAMRLVRDIREVRVWSPRNAAKFAAEHNVTVAASAEECVRGADIVCVVTGSDVPVLKGEWLSPGMHINAVGANRPNWRELDDDCLRRTKIYVESREAAFKESGDVIAAGSVFGEIGEVVNKKLAGRETPDEITLFKSLGQAVEDIAAADLVYKRAIASTKKG